MHVRPLTTIVCFVWMLGTCSARSDAQESWPLLPSRDGVVEIPAQEWPQRPGPRNVRVLVHFPGGEQTNVGARTGILLTLHNWGGTDCVGTAEPRALANRLNVIALCVNYLQSGKVDSIDGPEPYDFGYLQALDALRALWWSENQLDQAKMPFARGRIFCTGGSGGGNVTLMANKLAPRTFACVVDLCGMKKLTDDVAFNLPGGSSLAARWSRDPASRSYLSLDEQELRFVGNPDHLATMRQLGTSSKIVVVHGREDTTCPFADAEELVERMQRAGIDVESKFIGKEDLDGSVFTSAGHALGNRTEIVFRVAERYLADEGEQKRERSTPSDFERRDEVRYRTSGGEFVVSYANGYPIGRFVAATPLVEYADHQDLQHVRRADGASRAVTTIEDWETRRSHVIQNFQQVTGTRPSPLRLVPLDTQTLEEVRVGSLLRRKISFQSDATDRVTAYLFIPESPTKHGVAAILCLHQTTEVGKDEPAGIRGDPSMKYALELAERGFVTLAPDYPSLGEHRYDFAPRHGYVSGTMKAAWDNQRAIDVLESLEQVDRARIGCIGHSLGGHNAIFTSVFESRIKAVVSSCGFTSLSKDDLPSWTGSRYMPRIANEFGNDVRRLPFDFHELVAALAPRPFFAHAADQDDDFDVRGVQDVMAAARSVYELYGAADRLVADYSKASHSFPTAARVRAYEFLERSLQGRSTSE